MKVAPTEAMEILGSLVHRHGHTDIQADHRLGKAVGAFWAEEELYCDKNSCLLKRFQRYSARLLPKILHGCGSWAWSRSLCRRLSVWEGSNLRRIVGQGRRLGEEFVDWQRRAIRTSRALYAKAGFQPLTVRVLRAIHRLAGEGRHFLSIDNSRDFLPTVLRWRESWWWHTRQAVGIQCDSANDEKWRHSAGTGHRGRKWDEALLKVYGHEWHELLEKMDWNDSLHNSAQAALTSALVSVSKPAVAQAAPIMMNQNARTLPAERAVQ